MESDSESVTEGVTGSASEWLIHTAS